MILLENDLYRKDLNTCIEKLDISALKGKKVFITGASGLICSAVVDMLCVCNDIYESGIKIIAAGRNPQALERRFGSRTDVEFFQYDALKADFPKEISKVASDATGCDPEADIIIHGAGNASPELYVNNPVETMLVNIRGVQNLLEYCRAKAACANDSGCRMVYISSSEVYGTSESAEPFVETDYGKVNIDNIRSSYPEAKRSAELLCRAYSSEYGVSVSIARPGHIYGPTAGEKDRRISSDFAFKAARGEELVMKSAGLQRRSYMYCVECAAAILAIVINGQSGEAYNIAGEDTMSIKEMASFMAKAGDVKLDYHEPDEAEIAAFNPMNNSSLNNEKLKGIGYRQMISGEEGICHTVRILKEMY